MFDLPLSLLFLFSSSSTILLFSFLHSPYSLLHNFNILTLRKRGGRGGGGGGGRLDGTPLCGFSEFFPKG